ncbi:unnamed protein product [Dimorphilus gyrociliatus]|uniref:Uncharacterized protein n=1 Tax=Dimorphilus gyrociliatus TaxID=2664684 RepID=A0A7I8VCU1_9ANNE|nr:unnamed protein product [Dimorphilus gyrociliatus]
MAKRSEVDLKKEDLVEDIDAYSYKAKILIENQAESLKYKVKDILKEASQKVVNAVLYNKDGEEPVDDIVKLCKNGVNFSLINNFVAFQAGNSCDFGDIVYLPNGLESFSWKKAKKFDKSMVVEGLCVSEYSKSLYVALCNDEESFSCIYKGRDSELLF